MLICRRDGDDRGDDGYRHDRLLNNHGRHRANKEARRLIERYGHPDRVLVSPFKRARETLEEMAKHFKRSVEIQQDPRIAQHLNSKQQINPRISPETLAMIMIDEDERTFQRRILDHVAIARSWAGTSVVWCITHQAIIE